MASHFENRTRLTLISIALGLLTLAVYWQVTHFEFLNFDDNNYVTENRHVLRGLTLQGVRAAFTQGHNAGWNPLAVLSHMLDVQLFGLHAGAHHGMNVLIHIMSTLMLFWVLYRYTDALIRSAFVAAFFALHPLHVESVAWVSSRKDVLSALGLFAMLGAYLAYARRPSVLKYLLMSACFVLGLLAKPTLVTAPFVLILLDYWPLKRLDNLKAFRDRVAEKVPIFVIAVACSIATTHFQIEGGAVDTAAPIPIGQRLANAAVSYVDYLDQTFLPTGLSPFYPHPKDTLGLGTAVLATALLILLSILAISQRRRAPFVLVGWLWYLGALVPVSGIIQFGGHARADRFTYIPLVGIFIAVVWATHLWCKDNERRRGFGASLGILLVLVCSTLTYRQVGYWKSSSSLFAHAVGLNPNNYLAHNNLGVALLESDREKALEAFQAALTIKPDYVDAHNNLGGIYLERGDFDLATQHYQSAINLRPSSAVARTNLGLVYIRQMRYEEGIGVLRETLKLDGRWIEARRLLGKAYYETGRYAQAIKEYENVLRADPAHDIARFELALSLIMGGSPNKARVQLERILSRDPLNVDALYNLGVAAAAQADVATARKCFERVLELSPGHELASKNLSILDRDVP